MGKRPDNRFEPVLEALTALCEANKGGDQRFGQLLLNTFELAGYPRDYLFNIEDDSLAAVLRGATSVR